MQGADINPFLGLKPYELKDRKKLYGRDKDLILMKDRIFSARTTLLFAGSGVGKTSFLNAKIRPEFDAQYCVLYHNQWTGSDEPLAALKKTITEQLPPRLKPEDVQSNGAASLFSWLRKFKRVPEGRGEPSPPEGNREPSTRCLLILDQFEEVFQYHAYERYFGQFIEELSELITDTSCNVRVLFSMREEFLGELSVFDNHIPDLFNNYYRLKCPNKLEALEIIKRTCAVESATVDEDNLKHLVDDLARLEKGETGTVERVKTAGVRQFVERDFVAPPYLQIACQRLWDAQFLKQESDAPFLRAYEIGDARRMLKDFCQEKLSALNDAERSILVDAFDFLVTKKGAKMAYELPSLAAHMDTDEAALKSVLLKLSNPESRILRASSGPDGVLWFELYHDMYAPIVDEWKRSYRLAKKAAFRKQVVRASISVGAVLLVILTYVSIHHWYLEPRWYKQLLRSADLQNPDKYRENESAFIKLHETFGLGSTAKELWAEAWRKRAINAERQEKDQEALLSWLQAAKYSSSPRNAQYMQKVASYLESFQYESLVATFRTDSAAHPEQNPPLFSADGKILLTLTDDLRVLRWDAQSGDFMDRSASMQTVTFTPQKARKAGQRDQDADDEDRTTGPQFRSFSGNLLAGFNASGFFILRIDNSSILWTDPPGGSQPLAGHLPKDISFSPDGRYFGTVDAGGTAKLFTLAPDQQNQPTLKKTFGSVNFLTFSPNNRFVLLQLKTQTLQLWDLDSQKMQVQTRVTGSDSPPIFTPDGKRILLRTSKKALIVDGITLSTVSDLGKRAFGFPFESDLTLLAGGETIVQYAFLKNEDNRFMFRPHGEILLLEFENSATGKNEKSELVWDETSAAVFNPDRKSILGVNDNGVARLRSLLAAPPKGRIITQAGHRIDVDYSKDRRKIGTLNENNENNEITVWNADTGQQIGATFTAGKVPDKDLYPTNTMILSPDASYVGLLRRDGLRLWEVAGGREVTLMHPKNSEISAVAFNSDSRLVVTATEHGKLRVWKDLQNPVPQDINSGILPSSVDLVLSPDGEHLAVLDRSSYSRSQLWDIFDLTTMRSLSITQATFGGFSAANTAIGSQDNEAFIWNLKDGSLSFKLSTKSPIVASAISSDGKLAMTSCNDGSVQLWSTSTGQMIGSPQTFEKGFSRMQFSADNKRAVGFSSRWVHISLITDRGLQYEGACFNGYSGGVFVLNESGTQFRRFGFPSRDTIAVEDVSVEFSPPSSTPAPDPQALLLAWQRRLDVQFDDRGQIVPRKWIRGGILEPQQ